MAKIIFLISFFYTLFGFSQTVSTLAGTTYGYSDGEGIYAQFKDPWGLCTDALGNIYVADFANNRIRKIEATGLNTVTTIAGSGVEGYADGTGTAAIFGGPKGICIDNIGNLYVTDFWNFKIRKITPTGVVTTFAGSTSGFADGSGVTAKFGYLESICIDSMGNLYVADAGNNKIRKITPTGIVSTIAGTTAGYLDGAVSVAKFDYPSGICIDSSDNLYIVDTFNRRIRKISNSGIVSTIAGSTWGNEDGQGTAAKFDFPLSICRDVIGNLFVTDANNNNIRKINLTGYVSTYAGTTYGYLDGDASIAMFKEPTMICEYNGNLFVSEQEKVRKITNNLSIDGFTLKKTYIYPNPNSGTFTLKLNEENVSVLIYDLLGKEVYKNNTIINTTIETNLVKGMYLVKIINDNHQTNSIKMIVN